ncbi:hypothetical protein OG21DRAFT_1501252 [Imleria badia]|nr:hypothetical protein OG21DRAFT_1501252 [Imleria badia]
MPAGWVEMWRRFAGKPVGGDVGASSRAASQSPEGQTGVHTGGRMNEGERIKFSLDSQFRGVLFGTWRLHSGGALCRKFLELYAAWLAAVYDSAGPFHFDFLCISCVHRFGPGRHEAFYVATPTSVCNYAHHLDSSLLAAPMRILKQICLLSLLFLALPARGARSGGTDVGVQANHEVAGNPSDTIKAASETSFLIPSYILEGIQNAYLPIALRITGALRTFIEPKPSPPDFWERAKKSEKILQDYVHRLLEGAATYFESTDFTDITPAMNHIVSATATFRDNIKDTLDARHITFDTFTLELEGIFTTIVNDLEKIHLPKKAPGHAERAEMVDNVLDDASQALIELATSHGIEEEVVTTYLLALKPQVQALTVAIGNINERHPKLLPALVFSVAVLLIPQSWILRPFLSLFGFGPSGPVKGSAAAWLQRYFWGRAVASGSWFAWLQAAGMGVLPNWAGLVTQISLWIIYWSSLLFLALPTRGASLGRSGMDVGVQANHEVAESPGDTIKAASEPSFLAPYYILESIDDALPAALHVTGALEAFVETKRSPQDFWEMAKKSEIILEDYVHLLLEAAATYFESADFTDITSAMNHIVNTTATFRDDIKDALDARNITFDTFSQELEGIFMTIVNDLANIPSPNEAPGHAERAEMVGKVLDDVSQPLIKLAMSHGIEEQVVTTYLLALKPQVQTLTVVIGDINEQHPQLLPALAFSVAILLIPESWILRSFLSLFGFGPSGPVKGSAAAWLQIYFWGGAVESGSWFAWLQAAGMGGLPEWAGLVTKTPLLIGVVLEMFIPGLNHE